MKKCISTLLIIFFALSLCACETNQRELREEDIHAICELATYECYYNNVAKIEKEPNNIFQKKRTLWLEYEGVATIGVDLSQISVKVDDDKVTIALPPAELFEVSPVTDSFKYISSQDGFLFKNKIDAKDQTEAVTKGQEEIKKALSENNDLFVKAEKRAKDLIEGFIKKMYGDKYEIEWKKA